MLNLEVGNTWAQILWGDPELLAMLSHELQYPTDMADLLTKGWVDPETMSPGWDGWVRLLRQPKTKLWYFPSGLVDLVTRLANKWGHQVDVKDTRVRPLEGMPDLAAGKIELRDYQVAAVKRGVEVGRGVLDMPPRSGKTRTMVELHRQISLPTIWIAPTDRIVVQTQQVIEEFYGPNYSMHLVGQREESKAARMPVVVATAATASLLSPEFYQTRQMLCVDEWHHSAAKTYRDIFKLCDHIFYRFGMTGTHFRSGTDDLEMWGLLSNTIYQVSSAELLRRGYLVPTKIVFVPVQSKKLRGVPKGYITGHGKFGIHEHEERNQLVAQAAWTLAELGRRVLILVGTKAQGYKIRSFMRLLFPAQRGTQFEPVEFVSTDMDRPKQGKILSAFLTSDEVRVLIGTSLLGEGVDLPAADALIYARGESAEVSLVQNAYRVGTAVPGKRSAIIVDFADRHHRKLMLHSHERLNTYLDEPTFSVDVLQAGQQFGEWARTVCAKPIGEAHAVDGGDHGSNGG